MERVNKKGISVIIGVLGWSCLLFWGADSAGAKDPDYPTKPITFYVHMAAGGTTDIAVRALCDAVSPHLGQPFTIINKPGAGMTLGAMAVMNAKPDGYTIGSFSSAHVYFLPNMEDSPYKNLDGFEPIVRFSSYVANVTAKEDAPYKTWKEMIEWARKHPKDIKVSVPGPKSRSTQGVALWKVEQRENVKFTYMVTKSSAESLSMQLGDHINLEAMVMDSARMEHLKNKSIRLLAFICQDKTRGYEDIPSFKEMYGFSGETHMGIWGPKGLPPYVLKKLDDAFAKGIKDPKFIDALERLYCPVTYKNRADFTKEVMEMYAEGGDILKKIRADEEKEKQ